MLEHANVSWGGVVLRAMESMSSHCPLNWLPAAPASAFPCTPSLLGLWPESGEVEIQNQRGVSVKLVEGFANRKTHYLVACMTECNTNGQ